MLQRFLKVFVWAFFAINKRVSKQTRSIWANKSVIASNESAIGLSFSLIFDAVVARVGSVVAWLRLRCPCFTHVFFKHTLTITSIRLRRSDRCRVFNESKFLRLRRRVSQTSHVSYRTHFAFLLSMASIFATWVVEIDVRFCVCTRLGSGSLQFLRPRSWNMCPCLQASSCWDGHRPACFENCSECFISAMFSKWFWLVCTNRFFVRTHSVRPGIPNLFQTNIPEQTYRLDANRHTQKG